MLRTLSVLAFAGVVSAQLKLDVTAKGYTVAVGGEVRARAVPVMLLAAAPPGVLPSPAAARTFLC